MFEHEHYSHPDPIQEKDLQMKNIDAKEALSLKNQYIAELLRLQNNDVKSERNKDKVVSLAKSVILCLKIIQKSKENDNSESSESKEERSSGFDSKRMKKKMYKRLGGCLACGGGTLSSSSRHSSPIELHHISPRLYGGDDSESNALLICRNCHSQIHS